MKQFVDNAIKQLKQTYEISPESEALFRRCYETLFKLTAEQEEHGINNQNRQQIEQANRDMVELLHGCSFKAK